MLSITPVRLLKLIWAFDYTGLIIKADMVIWKIAGSLFCEATGSSSVLFIRIVWL